jgi:hypothetical protein
MLPPVTAALRTTTGLLLSTAVLMTGCGGSETMRVTLSDDGCTYKGDTTPAPGRFDIEFENKTSRWAIFTVAALAAGKTVEDVRQTVERGGPADGLFVRGAGGVHVDPHETKALPVNQSSGRLVIHCWVHNSPDGLQSDYLPPPDALYVVPVELDVR